MKGLIQTFREVSSSDLAKETRKSYETWLWKFYKQNHKPASTWSGPDITAFIVWMDNEGYALKSRKVALNALMYAFKRVLNIDPGMLDLPKIHEPPPPLKTIPTREELSRIFAALHGQAKLMCGLLYGAGLRVRECCELRVKDIDFSAGAIGIHAGKGGKSRQALLPITLAPMLQKQIAWRTALHEYDISQGDGLVDLPSRLAHKYKSAPKDLAWQFLFPSQAIRDHHRWRTTPEFIQTALRKVVRALKIYKRITPHTLRHAFATHSLRENDIETIRILMGHESLETTQTYIHADSAKGTSPLDKPFKPKL